MGSFPLKVNHFHRMKGSPGTQVDSFSALVFLSLHTQKLKGNAEVLPTWQVAVDMHIDSGMLYICKENVTLCETS